MVIFVIINIILICSIWCGIDSFIVLFSRVGFVCLMSVEFQQVYDELVVYFIDKYLGGLEDGLFEMFLFMDVGVVVIMYVLVVLWRGCV